MTSKHDRRDCVRCHREITRSATGLCFRCRPAPDVVITGDVCRIGAAFDIPTDKALILAHRILDVLSPSYTEPNKEK